MSVFASIIVNDCPMPMGRHGKAGRLSMRAVLAQYAAVGCHCMLTECPDAQLAERTGLHPSSVRRARYALVEQGFLVVVAKARPMGKGKGSLPVVYRINADRLAEVWLGVDRAAWDRWQDKARRCPHAARPRPVTLPQGPPPPVDKAVWVAGRPPLERAPTRSNVSAPPRAQFLSPVSTTSYVTTSTAPPPARDDCGRCGGTGIDLHAGGQGAACACWYPAKRDRHV